MKACKKANRFLSHCVSRLNILKYKFPQKFISFSVISWIIFLANSSCTFVACGLDKIHNFNRFSCNFFFFFLFKLSTRNNLWQYNNLPYLPKLNRARTGFETLIDYLASAQSRTSSDRWLALWRRNFSIPYCIHTVDSQQYSSSELQCGIESLIYLRMLDNVTHCIRRLEHQIFPLSNIPSLFLLVLSGNHKYLCFKFTSRSDGITLTFGFFGMSISTGSVSTDNRSRPRYWFLFAASYNWKWVGPIEG